MEKLRTNKWIILSAVLIGTVMGPIDGSVTNIAMPQLAKIFHTDITTTSWISMTYLLMLSSLMLTFGRLGDMVGYKKLYQYGLITFSVTSAILSMSNNIYMLIVVRAFQAVGAGMLMSMAPAIITATFPPNERGKALGFNAMAVSIGLSIGPTLGGFLLTYLGWRSIFYINIPIGIIGFIWAQIVVPDNKGVPEKFDPLGAMSAFIFLTGLLLFISEGGTWGWTSIPSMISLATFIVFFIIFIIIENKLQFPMLDLSLFKIRLFTFGNLSTLINFMAQNTMTFLTPFLLQKIGYSTDVSGIIMTSFPLIMLVVAPLSGVLSDRYGAQILSTIGALITATALFSMSTLNLHSSMTSIMLRLGLFGIGNGIFQTPNNSSVMGSVSKNRLGIASAFLATMRNAGMVLGIAMGSAIFTNRQMFYESLKINSNSAFLFGLRDAYIVAGVLSIICALTSLVRDKINKKNNLEKDGV
ncbi:MFS transporter [Thermoanaerobacterium thermosaccharolyticum]|uniref:Drug resistance transporter, EmrB/QacA subfamily n=1 Tax=Thermoanaerobacterium thermosaccharolyticum M0795 TaxID=698948 RepID=L0IK72_THETR|nr:MFS transporter [Thermoanaerobacterium thermosaccharolyticum]AGB18646.1 drug resistance transporter, EmrB/QacA subfamily [Thermoanaerobacterium thermosaccharolyticum M0795]